MRDNEREELLIAYLYGELSPDQARAVKRSIDTEPEWTDEWNEIRSTVGVLRKWEDVEPPVHHVMTQANGERRSSRSGGSLLRKRLRSTRAIALAVSAAALLLVLLNTNMEWENGRVGISFGAPESSRYVERASTEPGPEMGVPLELASDAASSYLRRDEYLKSQGEMIRFLATLIRESEDRQVNFLTRSMQDYIQDAEVMREADIGIMGAKVDEMERSTETLLKQIAASRQVEIKGTGEEQR